MSIMPKITNALSSTLNRRVHKSTMQAFTLFGAYGSTNTDRVRLTLAEGKFTNYEVVLLDLRKGEQKVSLHSFYIGVYLLLSSHITFNKFIPRFPCCFSISILLLEANRTSSLKNM